MFKQSVHLSFIRVASWNWYQHRYD